MLFALKIFSGVGIICLFVFYILYSLDKDSSRFLKYLLAYIVFFVAIGFLFFIFSNATPYIALLAGVGLMILILKGSLGTGDNSPETDDLE